MECAWFDFTLSCATIRAALRARYLVRLVAEYQDLVYALHELVLLLCFDGGMRLFAVGDADQSI
jgi:DNA helicase-2/ATP-dependent DNA helicase PcrA